MNYDINNPYVRQLLQQHQLLQQQQLQQLQQQQPYLNQPLQYPVPQQQQQALQQNTVDYGLSQADTQFLMSNAHMLPLFYQTPAGREVTSLLVSELKTMLGYKPEEKA